MREAIHPGEILADELEEIGISSAELARQLHVPANRISKILRGERSITGDTAMRLGHWFGTTAQYWMNLQANYELRLAQQKSGEEIKALPQLVHAESEPASPSSEPVHRGRAPSSRTCARKPAALRSSRNRPKENWDCIGETTAVSGTVTSTTT